MNPYFQACLALESLTNYRSLLEDRIVARLSDLLRSLGGDKPDKVELVASYARLVSELMTHEGWAQTGCPSLREHVLRCLYHVETPFSRAAERMSFEEIPQSLLKAAQHDLKVLERISGFSASMLKQAMLDQMEDQVTSEFILSLPEWQNTRGNLALSDHATWADDIRGLADFHKRHGSGIFAQFKGFIWERRGSQGYLKEIAHPDPVQLSDFIGYEHQRNQLIQNTLQFLSGYAVNNVLLYGDRGTGKSSTVKALLNAYHERGLRMIEIPKHLLCDFTEVVRLVQDRPQKFIIFIDDLAFEDNEENYTALKAVLEGGLERRPDNLAIYATSNRRHLIKERFIDRKGLLSDNPYEEVHASDSIQEKLSLADRFGITITFTSPDQDKYLDIVEGILKLKGLDLPRDTIRREAIQWEMHYNGRSPRTAQQFSHWLAAKSGLEGTSGTV